jgi:restriction system protein
MIPDYQKLMLPILRFAGDGKEHSLSEAADAIAQHFALSEEDRRELLPSGNQRKLYNRVGWSRFYLLKAGILEAVGRGRFKITDRGLSVLTSNPPELNVRFLEQYPEFLEFRGATRQARPATDSLEESLQLAKDVPQHTPQEMLETSYQILRRELAQELLDKISLCSPRFFEELVVDLLVAMGYGGSRRDAGQAIGRTGDEGVDGIIKEDRLGLDAIYIQAKRWKATVGRPDIQGFAGSLEGHRARKGVFITTSQFSPDAKDYVSRIERKIILIDGQQLANLCIDFGVGAAEVTSYTVKRIDLDYFEEE